MSGHPEFSAQGLSSVPVLRRWGLRASVAWEPGPGSQPLGVVHVQVAASALTVQLTPHACSIVSRAVGSLLESLRYCRYRRLRPTRPVHEVPELWWQYAVEVIRMERQKLLWGGYPPRGMRLVDRRARRLRYLQLRRQQGGLFKAVWNSKVRKPCLNTLNLPPFKRAFSEHSLKISLLPKRKGKGNGAS